MKISIMLFSFLTTFNLIAGEGVVGNGGNIISCETLITSNQIEFHNKTLELFELSYLYGLTSFKPLENLDREELVTERILLKIKSQDKRFFSILKNELINFSKNSKYFDFNFNFSNDLGQTVVPYNCKIETVIFQKKIKPYYLISNRWKILPPITKASLKLHEIIYRYRLSVFPNTINSFSVRKLNAYLFSDSFFESSDSKTLSILIKQLEY